MNQKRIFQNALFLLFCLGVNVSAVTYDFRALPHAHAQHHNFKSESESTTREKREVSFSTATDDHRDFRQGRVPTRVRIGVPKVTMTRTEVSGVLGSNLTLECFIESFPKSTNFWMKGELDRLQPKANVGKYVITEDTFGQIQFWDRFRLQILNVEHDDLGNAFRCVASNEYGTDTGLVQISAPRYLEIKQIPATGFLAVHLQSRVVLQCEVKGYPLAGTYWFLKSTGEQLLWSADYRVIVHKINSLNYISQLHIRSIAKHDFTTFICMSKNSFGESQKEFRIYEKGSSSDAVDSKLSSWTMAVIAVIGLELIY